MPVTGKHVFKLQRLMVAKAAKSPSKASKAKKRRR